MTGEGPEPNSTSDHIMGWLEDSVSFLPSFLEDPYDSNHINSYQWWCQGQDPITTSTNSLFSSGITTEDTITSITPTNPTIPIHEPVPSDSWKKRKVLDDPVAKTSQNNHQKKNRGRRINERTAGNKRGSSRGSANNCNNGNNKEGRWAEQLLNPCAMAITSGNMKRVQHLLFVLNELASSTGDANHRLAWHGLRALTHHLSSAPSISSSLASVGTHTFACTEPRFFQQSLFKFNEVSPWFAFPNNIANSSILQILTQEPDRTRNLHILDIGVSHGMQWPTLLEALTCRAGGPPPLVRITVIAATTENDQNLETPFSIGPPGDNCSSRLLNFASSMNINLQIHRVDNHPLRNLNTQTINASPDEALIVCAQFRLHCLNHSNTLDERTEFLTMLRNLEPKGVILSENNMDCSCIDCGDFATGFSRRAEYMWRFLESTSSAFKGRETEERRVMEGEAAKALTIWGEMNEGKEKWCERMRVVGFVGELLGEDAIDGARALLSKYDSNWEMRVEEKDACVGLWWKGQPISFCSLWKLDMDTQ